MSETTQPAVAGPVEPTVRTLVERLRLHGRADDLNALVDDTKRLRHSEREAIEALQTVAMQAAAELERLQPRADLYQWLRGGADVPQFSVRWPRWEVRNWDGRHWNTLFADGLDAALRRDMEGERPNVRVNPDRGGRCCKAGLRRWYTLAQPGLTAPAVAGQG